MQALRYSVILCASTAAVLLWASCTCDPIYPPEAGDSCDVVGETVCSFRGDADRSPDLLVCVDRRTWQVDTACDDFGMYCSEGEDGPVCTEQPCSPEQTRCTTDYGQVTFCNAEREWEPGELCDKGRICKVEDDMASCVEELSCAEGAQRCSADAKAIETCNATGDWAVTKLCSPGEICELGTFVPICVAGPLCSAANELDQRCSPDEPVWIQECQSTGTSPPYDWVNSLDCSTLTPDYVCQQDPGEVPFCFPAP